MRAKERQVGRAQTVGGRIGLVQVEIVSAESPEALLAPADNVVSKRLTPASRHMSTCLLAPEASVEPTLLKPPSPPKVIMPRVMVEPKSPERPSLRYSIRSSLHSYAIKLYANPARRGRFDSCRISTPRRRRPRTMAQLHTSV